MCPTYLAIYMAIGTTAIIVLAFLAGGNDMSPVMIIAFFPIRLF
jgi:hypothetical protein